MSSSKIAVDAGLLRALLRTAAAATPFDPDFYRATYPDIEAAHASGKMPDLHQHYVETGYLEGRCGALPPFDKSFYVLANRDVARALKLGQIASGQQHYIRSGAAEGRNPSPVMARTVSFWADVLGLPSGPAAPGTHAAGAAVNDLAAAPVAAPVRSASSPVVSHFG